LLRVVFDTNVIVSILIRKGKPRDLLNSVLEEKMNIILSEELFGEFSAMMGRPHLQKCVNRPSSEHILGNARAESW
jgi:putative PIN family toxin of toxin-antitoxin system